MKADTQSFEPAAVNRITSIDFFRGFTMFLLAGEATELYGQLEASHSGFIHFIGTQLSHHEWHGLHFWDLIQPFFMFIVGVAIPFAVANRMKKGDSTGTITCHAIKRSLILLFLGWALYCLYSYLWWCLPTLCHKSRWKRCAGIVGRRARDLRS